jgi:hypothetical protein
MATRKTSKTTATATANKIDTTALASGDVYQPLPGVPSISKEDFERLQEQVAGQQRSLDIAAGRAQALLKAHNVDATEAKAAAAADKAASGWVQRDIGLQVLQQKETQDQNTLAFTTSETGLLNDLFAVRTESMTKRLENERQLLDIEVQQFAAKVETAKAQLRDMTVIGSLPGFAE